MTSRPAVIALGLVVASAFVGTLGHAVQIRREADASIAERAAHITALTERRDAATRRLVTLQVSIPEIHDGSENSTTTVKSAAAVSVAPKPPSIPSGRIAKDPGLQVLKQEAEHGLRHLRYASFVRSRSLSAQQAETLERILCERDTCLLDLRHAFASELPMADDPATTSAALALRRELMHATENALRDLLGDAGLKALHDYDHTVDLRQSVSSFSVAAVMLGEPLTDLQVEQLLQLLTQSSRSAHTDVPVTLGSIDWDKAASQMQALLSPSQFAHLSQIEPNALGGSTSRFMIKFLSAAQSAARQDREKSTASSK